MRKLLVIGIGAGNPEFVTIQAIKALNRTDVFFILDKGTEKGSLQDLRRDICDRYIEHRNFRFVSVDDPIRDERVSNYNTRVEAWHAERAALIEQMVQRELGEDGCGAFLVWGDPSLYDSTLRILDRVLDRGVVSFEIEVIPGITSVQALAASHRMPLHRIGEPVLITTGRRLRASDPARVENVVVMLDGECSFESLAGEADLDIYWGAFLGTPHEVVLSGDLAEVAPRIPSLRAELREKHGWVMDIYSVMRRERVAPAE